MIKTSTYSALSKGSDIVKEKELEDAILVISSMLNVIRRFADTLRTAAIALDLETVLQEILPEISANAECDRMEPLMPEFPYTGERHVLSLPPDKKEQLSMALVSLDHLLGWAEREPAIRGEEQITGRYIKALQASREIVRQRMACTSENCDL